MNTLLTSLRLFLWMTFLIGIVYPMIILLFGFSLFNTKSHGDLIEYQGQIVGAKLIGQKFESERYFFGRPSAVDYNPLNSGGSNLGPTSLKLREAVLSRKNKLKLIHNVQGEKIPSELLFTSGSGLDPHISLETAYFQISRIVKARNLNPANGEQLIKNLIDSLIETNHYLSIQKPYINVLLLNISLDQLK